MIEASTPILKASIDSLQITDADYADFKKLVKEADFTYDRQSEQVLKTLKEVAEFEGYMEGAEAEFKALEQKLNHNLDRDLDYFRNRLRNRLLKKLQPVISSNGGCNATSER